MCSVSGRWRIEGEARRKLGVGATLLLPLLSTPGNQLTLFPLNSWVVLLLLLWLVELLALQLILSLSTLWLVLVLLGLVLVSLLMLYNDTVSL